MQGSCALREAPRAAKAIQNGAILLVVTASPRLDNDLIDTTSGERRK